MENNNQTAIDVLNTLVEINNDRIEGYQTASKETEDRDLKNLFSQLSQTSRICKQELSNEITKLGGTPTADTKIIGKFFRAWMDVKAALTGNNRKVILDSCEFGEDKALKTYDNALKTGMGSLTTDQQRMISDQRALLQLDHDQVKRLRDTAVKA
jgi:uncharacterized protein (TIGR02284 family)